MALIDKTLRRLLPAGSAWRGGGFFGQLIEALGVSINRVREFLRGVRTESIPGTADLLLVDWFNALGIKWDPNRTADQARRTVSGAYTAIGGQSLDYLMAQVQAEFPDVYIQEVASDESGVAGETVCGDSVCSAFYDMAFSYKVVGNVLKVEDYYRLFNLLGRIAPLHLEPDLDIRIIEDSDIARTGIAVTGKAITGRIE